MMYLYLTCCPPIAAAGSDPGSGISDLGYVSDSALVVMKNDRESRNL